MQAPDWHKLWLGGFCAPGIYGSPIRASDANKRPTLADILTLPSQVGDGQRHHNGDADKILRDWSARMGGRPVWIARSLREARLQLLLSFGVVTGGTVLLPANATHPLVEIIKQVGAKPLFAALDCNLGIVTGKQCRLAWLQPLFGLPVQDSISAEISILDHGDSVPGSVPRNVAREKDASADIELYGLCLSHNPDRAGALVVFNQQEHYTQFLAENEEVDPSIYQRADEQLQRLYNLAPMQESALDYVWTGVREAAGLPVLPLTTGSALAHGIAVRVPEEGSPSLFWSYASRENTPIQWVPELRPIHYAASASRNENIAMLERWFFVPVSPTDDIGAMKQSILGIVKTAEYLGLRWRTDPMRAAQYATKLDELYGPEHDAYRPAFSTPATIDAESIFRTEDFLAQTCSPAFASPSGI